MTLLFPVTDLWIASSSFTLELTVQLLLPPLAAGGIALSSVFTRVFILELLQSDSVVQPCKPSSGNQCDGMFPELITVSV